MSEIAVKLREARALIERGWCQRAFIKNTPFGCAYCADGAICATAGDGEGEYGPMLAALKRATGVPSHADIWSWNDTPERTQAEVLEAFDRAIALAETNNEAAR